MTTDADKAIAFALAQLGKPYQWGATGPDSYDCSGLTQAAYASAGLTIGRTTYQQITDGVPVPFDQIEPGDLVFPESGHVQLAIGNGRVIEAPQTGEDVRITTVCWGGTPYAVRRVASAPGTTVSQFGAGQTSGPPKAWTGTPNLTVTPRATSVVDFQPRPSASGL